MATIDGRPAQYGITLKQLRELMEFRGREGITKISEFGGVQELCRKLYTSSTEGKLKVFLCRLICLLIIAFHIIIRFREMFCLN